MALTQQLEELELGTQASAPRKFSPASPQGPLEDALAQELSPFGSPASHSSPSQLMNDGSFILTSDGYRQEFTQRMCRKALFASSVLSSPDHLEAAIQYGNAVFSPDSSFDSHPATPTRVHDSQGCAVTLDFNPLWDIQPLDLDAMSDVDMETSTSDMVLAQAFLKPSPAQSRRTTDTAGMDTSTMLNLDTEDCNLLAGMVAPSCDAQPWSHAWSLTILSPMLCPRQNTPACMLSIEDMLDMNSVEEDLLSSLDATPYIESLDGTQYIQQQSAELAPVIQEQVDMPVAAGPWGLSNVEPTDAVCILSTGHADIKALPATNTTITTSSPLPSATTQQMDANNVLTQCSNDPWAMAAAAAAAASSLPHSCEEAAVVHRDPLQAAIEAADLAVCLEEAMATDSMSSPSLPCFCSSFSSAPSLEGDRIILLVSEDASDTSEDASDISEYSEDALASAIEDADLAILKEWLEESMRQTAPVMAMIRAGLWYGFTNYDVVPLAEKVLAQNDDLLEGLVGQEGEKALEMWAVPLTPRARAA